jgi:hypothetical protein
MRKTYFDILNQEGGNNNSFDFGKLNLEEWISFLDDYYSGNTSLIDIIISTPKGESVYSYLMPIIDEQSQTIKGLFANATEILIKRYYQIGNYEFLNIALDSIRYLELSIDFSILKIIVLNNEVKSDIRANAANTLSIVNENLLIPFWNEIDFTKNLFLIPSYITYFQNKAPVIGLSKLLMVVDTPKDLTQYDTILLNSLNNILVSKSDYSDFQTLYPKFPQWVKNLIADLFEDYPDLNALKKINENFLSNYTIAEIEEASGIKLSNINLSILPKEIQQAFKQLISNVEIDKRRLRYFKSTYYSIANFPFFQIFDNLQNELTLSLKEMFERKGKIESPINQEHGTFEITERSSLYSAITGFTYPYYLDKKREFVAGVVPFAYQDYFAIIIAKENKLYKRWVTLRNRVLEEESANISSNSNSHFIAELMISKTETKEWFKGLLNEMNNKNGSIHFIEGYIFDDVVTEFQNRNFYDNVHINRMNQEGTNINDLNTLKFFQKTTTNKKNTLKTDEKEQNKIFILDPVEAFCESHNNSRIRDLIDSECYDVINVRHGLKYPIGVGFSLYALPFLLENNNWKIIQDKAIEELDKLRSNNNILLDRFGWSFPFNQNNKILAENE